MLLGCIADDFTGASDLANTLARGGMRTTQFCSVPDAPAPSDCEAGIVALKTRSISVEEAISQSLEALDWLQRQGCSQYFFKYCSTFDSTKTGNIGPVAEAILNMLDAPSAIVCPSFPATGRTVYMGHLFVGDRLLDESGMENHPITPMSDADIRRWLGHQTSLPIGHVRLSQVARGHEAISDAIAESAARGERLIVVDAVSNDDLTAIGRAMAGARFITGGSGVALGLPANFHADGLLRDAGSAFVGVESPAAVLSGSCSTTSRRQVEIYLQDHPSLFIDARDLLAGVTTVESAAEFVLQNAAEAPIVYSTADSQTVSRQNQTHGRDRSASAIESFFANLAVHLLDSGVRRIVVGGGETSGAVVKALQLAELTIGPEIDPGVPALASEKDGPVRLALKSGNFGSSDFFNKAVKALGT